MNRDDAKPKKRVFSIGHSNHPMEKFLELLKTHGIEILADVRSHPYAKYATHFDSKPLKEALAGAGIKYIFLGRELGGLPDDDEFYDDEGYILYSRVAASPKFVEALERLSAGAGQYKIAVMCGEEDPAQCHRRLLIGRVLEERGVRMDHIRGDGRVATEEELQEAEREPESDQLSLFKEAPKEKPWRSIQSVSPKGRRPNSSGR